VLALLGDMARCSQPGRRSTVTQSLPNDLLNSSRSSSNVAPAAAGFADTTMSRSSDIAEMHDWNTSLSLLRTAFLVTALPTFRETDSPSRGVPCSFGKACTEKSLPL
jgi:hypothetical protein